MSILQDNPQGRLDIAAVRVAEIIVRGPLEKMCNGLPLWDMGMGRVIEAIVIQEFPGRAIDPLDVARELGLVRRGAVPSQADGETATEQPQRGASRKAPLQPRRRYVRA